MSHAAPRRHAVRRGLVTLSTALVLAVAGPYGLASPAFAALPGHTMAGDFTAFNIDGDMAGPNDWNSLYGPGPTPQGRPSTGTVKSSVQSDPCNNAADDKLTGKIFDRSDPENDATHVDGWLRDTGKPTSKSDICQAGVAAEVVNVNGQYHYVLYEFLQREPSGTGDLSSFVHLEGGAPGRDGDVLVEFDFDPAGQGSTGVAFYDWTSTGTATTGGNPGWSLRGTPNLVFDSATGTEAGGDDTFIEFAVDLTASGILTASECRSFSATKLITRNGDGYTANLEDILQFNNPIDISNCSQTAVIKLSDPASVGAGPFTYVLSQTDGGAVHGAGLTPSDSDGSTSTITGSMVTGETQTWTNVISQPDYQIAESQLPEGWELEKITCTWYDIFTGTTQTATSPLTEGVPLLTAFQIPPAGLDNGVTTTCTIINRTSGVVVAKAGAGDPAKVFDFTATGKPAFGLSLGDSSGTLTYTPGSVVSIAEAAPSQSPGWVYAGAVCATPGLSDQVFSPAEPVTVTTVGGKITTCTFTNNQNGRIVVAKDGRGKTATDVFGFDTSYGPASPDFSLRIGESNTSTDLAPGAYTVAELLTAANTQYDPDYALVNIACVITTTGSGGSTATGYVQGNLTTTVTLAAGDIVTCTFTNNQQGRLIVKKATTLRDGTFSFTGRDSQGAQVLDGAITTVKNVTEAGDELTRDVNPGVYSVSESTSELYWTRVSATCVDGTTPLAGTTFDPATGALANINVLPGHIITCTFTNAKQTAGVKVAKQLVPANDPGRFDLSINSQVQSGPNGVGNGYVSDPAVAVVLGENVTVSETAHTGTTSGWYSSGLVCDNGITPANNAGTSGNFAVTAPGITVICTFTNTRRSADLTLTKEWVNGHNGDRATLSAAGTSGLSPTATGSSTAAGDTAPAVLRVFAGETVNLGEALAPANVGSYTASLSCTDAGGLSYTTPARTGSYAVPATPAAVTCTFTNTRTSATLTLRKHWINGAQGDTAGLDITSRLGQSPAGGATSVADGSSQFTDSTHTVGATVLSGETVSLAEVLGAGNRGSYTSGLSCSAAGLDPEPTAGTGGSYTMPKTAAAVTCTFTNNRTSVQLTLEKEWINGADGDTATLGVTSTFPGLPEVSEANGDAGSYVDTPVKTVTVLSGETVGLTESPDPANHAGYATSLVCSGAPLTYQAGALNGSISVPKSATTGVTCRWTNEAGRGTIVIVKNVEGADGTFDFSGDWTDPDTGSSVDNFALTTEGGTTSRTWTGVVTPKDGSPFTVTEMDPAPGYDGTSLVCAGNRTGDTSSAKGLAGTIDLDPGETVTCTYTNTQRATILIVKDAVPNDDQDFTFNTSGSPLPASFILDDDADATRSNTFTSALVPAGKTYTVNEGAVPGWTVDLTASACSNQAAVTANGVSLTPAPGQTITCTFVNRAAPGSIEVTKSIKGVADDYGWSFDISVTPVEAGVTSPQQAAGTGNSSDTVTFGPLVLNRQYTITEEAPAAGWTQGQVTCSTGADENPRRAGFQVTITQPGQSITCSLVNTAAPGDLEVTKTVTGVLPDYQWSIPFTISPVPAGAAGTRTATTEDPTVQWGGLLTGETYTITEQVPAGWTGGVITCRVTHADDSTEDLDNTILVEAGDSISCAVTNAVRPGGLTIVKTAVGGDGSFDFTLTGEENGIETEKTITTEDGTGTATVALVPGVHYTLSEVNPGSGWTRGDFTCTRDGKDVSIPFTVGPAEDIRCAITNTAKGKIVIVKNVDGADGTFGFNGSWTSGTPRLDEGSFEITTDEGTGSETFMDVLPGSYSVSEDNPFPDYLSRVLSCSDSDGDGTGSTIDGPDRAGNIRLDPGETVTCVFENTQTATVIIDKETIPEADPAVFDFQWFLPNSGFGENFTLTDTQEARVFGGLNPDQDWGITEMDEEGWRFLDLECLKDGESFSGATVDGQEAILNPAPGDVITCTYTNGKRGPVDISKTVTSGPVENADAGYTVTYSIRVSSESYVSEEYNLADQLHFGDGITVTEASAASTDATVNPAWNGTTVTELTAAATTIDPDAVHTFTVTTTSTIAPGTGSDARDCEPAGDGDGTGFLNRVLLTVVDGAEGEAEACAPAPDEADVAILKSGTEKVLLPNTGGSAALSYTLTVTNNGPTEARDVIVTDTMPAEVQAGSVTPSAGSCTNSGTAFTCSLGVMEVGQEITIGVQASVTDYTGNGPFINTATVSSSTPDLNGANNQATHVTRVERAALAATGTAVTLWFWPAAVLLLIGTLLVLAAKPKRRRAFRIA